MAMAALTALGTVAAPAWAVGVSAEDASLAEQFEGYAERAFPARVPVGKDAPFVFAMQAALMSAAGALDPTQPRYFRKAAEAQRAVGDAAGENFALRQAIASNAAVNGSANPDEVSYIRLFDLNVEQYQTAAKQVDYLKKMEASPLLPRSVVAHLAYRIATIEHDQGRDANAQLWCRKALVHDPFSNEALRLSYALLPASTGVYDRVQALLSLLKSNPLQPEYARSLALLLAEAGLTQEPLTFFQLSVTTAFAQGRPQADAMLDWAAEWYIADDRPDAYGLVQRLLQLSPDYTAAWYLDLLIVRGGGYKPEDQARELRRATNAMSNRLAGAINDVRDAAGAAGGPAAAVVARAPRATTRPLDADGPVPPPDLRAALAALAPQPDGAALPPPLAAAKAELVRALGDLAGVYIYFGDDPKAADPLLQALRQASPADDLLLGQLVGWQQLKEGRDADAAKTFTPLAMADPLAALGLLRIQLKTPAQAEPAIDAARKLLQAHPDHLTGAFLIDGLSSQRVRLTPKPGAAGLLTLLQKYPQDLARNANSAGRLYTVHVEPVQAGRHYGQALLARVTLSNFGVADLTVGDDGFIRPGLLFEIVPTFDQAAPGGPPPPVFPAFDNWSGRVVLHQRESLTQVVRVDQAPLLAELDRTAPLMFGIDGRVTTNPDTRLGGIVTQFTKPFARVGINQSEVADCVLLLNGAASNPGGVGLGGPGGGLLDKVTAVGELQAFVRGANGVRNQNPQVLQDAAAALNVIHKARQDPSPSVAAWAALAEFSCQPAAADRSNIIRDLLVNAAPDQWPSRQVALMLAPLVTDAKLTRTVLEQLANDPQPTVAALARAELGLLNLKEPIGPQAAPGPQPGVAPAGVPPVPPKPEPARQ